jgi:hypothetical protein
MIVRGACHCGNVSFELTWEPEPPEIPARACDCTFCVKHGGVWTSNPKGALRVKIEDPAEISPYLFGTRTATFHVCRRCGVPPLVTSEIEGRVYAVVNANTFDAAARAKLKPSPVSFEGEDERARLGRRQRNWIADVVFKGG